MKFSFVCTSWVLLERSSEFDYDGALGIRSLVPRERALPGTLLLIDVQFVSVRDQSQFVR